MLIGKLCERFYGLKSGLDQGCTVFGFKTGKRPAHLPVCRVQKLGHFIYLRIRGILAPF
jgi:hypothetical protein